MCPSRHNTSTAQPTSNMKSFIVFAVIAIVAVQSLTDEQKQKIKTYHKDCAVISKVTDEVISKARKGEFEDNESLKEHLLCFSKKAGFQNEGGDIQFEVIKQKLQAEIQNEEETDRLIKLCAIKKDTPQLTAFESIKCYYSNSSKHISLA